MHYMPHFFDSNTKKTFNLLNQNMIYKKNLSNNSIKKNIVSNLDKIILKIKSMYAPVKFVYKIQEF